MKLSIRTGLFYFYEIHIENDTGIKKSGLVEVNL